MARRRASAGTGVVNPLQRMFGAYLRVERSRHGLSSGDIAGRLKLSETYYRLVESGRAALNQALVLDIVAVFSGGRSAAGRRSISLPRLSLLLVGANWVGAEIASMEDAEDAGRISLAALAEQVAEFEQLVSRTIAFLDLPEGSSEQRRFLEEVVAPEISDFLTLDKYGLTDKEEKASPVSLDDVPSLNIDLIMDITESLAWRPFVHTENVAAQWEINKTKDFRELRGVYDYPALIINEHNLSIFRYEYLWEDRFIKFRALFLEECSGKPFADSDAAEKHWKKQFISSLEKRRQEAGTTRTLSKKERDKICFVCLSSDELKLFRARTNQLLSEREEKADAYWSFETMHAFPIAFLGRINGQRDSTRNLTLSDGNKRESAFDELWEAIQRNRYGEAEGNSESPG